MKHQQFLHRVWFAWFMISIAIGPYAILAEATTQSTPSMPPASAAQTQQQKEVLEPAAMEALNTMSSFLRTLPGFEVQSTFYKDEVLLSGQKILVTGNSTLLIQRPNKLFSTVVIDEKARNYAMYFDGKTFSMYGRNSNYYTSIPAPGTLRDLAMTTFAERDIEHPLQDLFLWGTEDSKQEVSTALFIADTHLQGIPCAHYAFRQQDVDWQVWIQQGETPLPLQLVITTTAEASQPQYSARLTWNLKPVTNDAMFVFTPPADAHPISFRPQSEPQE